MQVIPLFKNEEEKELRNRIKNMEVSIPSEWWDTNYSFNYTANENKPVFVFY